MIWVKRFVSGVAIGFCVLQLGMTPAESAEVDVLAALTQGAEVFNKFGFEGNEPSTQAVSVKGVGLVDSAQALNLSIAELFKGMPNATVSARVALPVDPNSPKTLHAAAVVGVKSATWSDELRNMKLGQYLKNIYGDEAVGNLTATIQAIQIRVGTASYRAFVITKRDPVKYGGPEIAELSGWAQALILFRNIQPTLSSNGYQPCRLNAACMNEVGTRGGFFDSSSVYREFWSKAPNRTPSNATTSGGTTTSECSDCKLDSSSPPQNSTKTSGAGHHQPGNIFPVPVSHPWLADPNHRAYNGGVLTWSAQVGTTQELRTTGYHEMKVTQVKPSCEVLGCNKTKSEMSGQVSCQEYAEGPAGRHPSAPNGGKVWGAVRHHNSDTYWKHVPISYFETSGVESSCTSVSVSGTAKCQIEEVPTTSNVIGGWVGTVVIVAGVAVLASGPGLVAGSGATTATTLGGAAGGATLSKLADQVLPLVTQRTLEILSASFSGACFYKE